VLSFLNSPVSLYLVIPVTPVPKARPRFAKGGWAYSDPKTKAFEKECSSHFAAAMDGQAPFVGPLAVELVFGMKKPKVPKFSVPAVRPDLDNLVKGVMDAANGFMFTDDGQIVAQHAYKVYSEEPQIVVSVWRLAL
jgi:Holliday junction resolvase RusA-like endonuclease